MGDGPPVDPVGPAPSGSIRSQYENLGVDRFYSAHGASYNNPHERELVAELHSALTGWVPRGVVFARVLDLGCGTGEATLALGQWLSANGLPPPEVSDATDPYTAEAFTARTGRPCLGLSFKDIAGGGGLLDIATQPYTLVLASFSLHLTKDHKELSAVCKALAQVADHLVVATPNHKPDILETMGWQLVAEHYKSDGSREHRVRIRLYKSLLPSLLASWE
eukprot:gene2004-3009_t